MSALDTELSKYTNQQALAHQKPEKVPYVILEACPDYKRPRTDAKYGVVNPEKLDEFFLDAITSFIEYNTDISNINTIQDLEKFWENYYMDSYMENEPWEARVFINRKWRKIERPSNASILACILSSGE